VTETNTLLSVGDVWTIRVGAGGTISSRGYNKARGAAGTSSVSNGFVEVVSVPGGGAGGSRSEGYRPTVGAAGGGGSGNNSTQAAGAEGNYASSVGGVLYGPYSGGWGGSEKAYGGGGGGAGANGAGATGGEGLASDITGVSVVYGSGGGGGGYSRVDKGVRHNGGEGGTNAGNGGNCEWDIVDDGATTNIVVTKASAPIANTGAGGAGGVSFGGGANYSDYGGAYVYATEGADGVVIVRYDIPDTPCGGGDVVTVTTNGQKVVYVHTFTNTSEAATFTPSVAFDGTSVRMLVVGGGGAGMDGLKNHNVLSAARYGGGGGGGGGVTETNALLSVGDVWTIRVGAGGRIPNHGYDKARGVAGASSVSNGVTELVLTPGGGAGGSQSVYPTEGAAGGGGSRNSSNSGNNSYYLGTNGTYRSFTFKVSEGMPVGPFKGGDSSTSSNRGAAGGGGGAGEAGNGKKGGEGLVSDITGADVTYGSGGGGGGMVRVNSGSYSQGATSGGNGGDGAGHAGGCELLIEDGGAKTNLYFTSVTAPLPNRGGGGAGGASFNDRGDDVYVDGELVERSSTTVHYATEGADGVVIIRYEVDLPRPKGFMVFVR